MFMQDKIDDINKRFKTLENTSSIVIWGAGAHTCKLFEKTTILSYKVKDIVDIDLKKQGGYYFGFIIKNPRKEINWQEVDAVIISVPNKEKQITEMLLKELRFSGNIIALYDADESEPFYCLYDKEDSGGWEDYNSWIDDIKSRLNVKKWVSEEFRYVPVQKKTIKTGDSIIIGLLHCEETSYNMIHSLYHAFAEDELCFPVVILQGKGYKNQYNELEKQMKEHGMRYEFDYNCTNKKFDVLIAHHVQLPPTEDVKKIINNSILKVAVPVGVISYNGQGINADDICSYQAKEIFCEKSIYEKNPETISDEFHYYITGNPKFDYIYEAYLHRVEIPERFSKLHSPEIKKIILWTTDHKPSFQVCTPDVAFDLYADMIFNYVKEHREIGLIFRPYRTYIEELIRDGLLTREDVDYFRSYCDNSENIVWDDEPDYSVSYSMADAILADAGCGIICSALPMMKPIGITLRWDMNSDEIISRNQEILDNHYLISSQSEMLSFIEMVKEEKDPNIEKRKELCKKYVTHFDGKNGERIKTIIKGIWEKI